MLRELRIRNLAIIESLTLPLESGFNVLSGETGAGKSIIVGALGLLLGERANADVVRTGADRAVVEGVFDAREVPEVVTTLDDHGLDVEDGLVVLRREVAAGGRSRAWINGSAVTTAVLAEAGRMLANLHGQHESQTLLHSDAQRAVVDAFADAGDLSRRVLDAFSQASAIRTEIVSLTARRETADRRADYLRHVVSEIADARLAEGEAERLAGEGQRLAHVEDLRAAVGEMRGAVESGDWSVLARLAVARKSLATAQRLDPTLFRLQEGLDSAFVSLEDLARELSAYEASLDTDPDRLARIDARRDVIQRVIRKYGGSVARALETLAEARAELDVLDTADLDLRTLGARQQEAERTLRDAAAELTRRREAGASRLAAEVTALLPALGLPDGRFAVALATRGSVSAAGAEDVEFRVALNVGHEERPLARVASGGELSRVMLALKTILARLDRVPTLVFDEVDAGIGGAVALQVGSALRDVSAHHQVVVITHLAQIAARAHHQIAVTKGARAGVTAADVAVVAGDARVGELARMLDGDPESPVSRAHARELLDAASAPRTPGPAPAAGRARPVAGPRKRHP
jgi:DNA repair protein RecN (Recombination protein N)